MQRPIVVIDTETATVRGAPHLLEIAAVRAVEGEIVEHFECLVRTEVPIEPEALACHGIGDDDVRDAPTPAEALERFSQFIGDDWLAAHGAGVDARVLGFEYARAGLEAPPNVMLDTLKLARRLIPEASDHKLDTLCQHLAIEVDVHHRALPDAVHCWKVLEECATRVRARAELALALPDGVPAPARFASAADGAHAWTALLELCGAPLTIAGSRPRAPRIPPRLRALEEACLRRTSVVLVYGEESALAQLPVLPRLLFQQDKRGYLEALCERSSTLKTYRLDRVHKVRER